MSQSAPKSGSPSDDSLYTSLENQLIDFTAQRNSIAGQIANLLEDVTFNNQAINEQQARTLISQANDLLSAVHTLAGN